MNNLNGDLCDDVAKLGFVARSVVQSDANKVYVRWVIQLQTDIMLKIKLISQ